MLRTIKWLHWKVLKGNIAEMIMKVKRIFRVFLDYECGTWCKLKEVCS